MQENIKPLEFSYKLVRQMGFRQRDIDNWFDPEYWREMTSWTAPKQKITKIRTLDD
jgi:hypothetical protein